MRSLRLQKPNPLLAKIRGKSAVWGSETTRLQKGSSSKKVKRNYKTDFEIDGENHSKIFGIFHFESCLAELLNKCGSMVLMMYQFPAFARESVEIHANRTDTRMNV